MVDKKKTANLNKLAVFFPAKLLDRPLKMFHSVQLTHFHDKYYKNNYSITRPACHSFRGKSSKLDSRPLLRQLLN